LERFRETRLGMAYVEKDKKGHRFYKAPFFGSA
jgi:hypothetical protein